MSHPWWWIDASRLLPLVYIFGACKGKPRSSKLNLSVRKAPTLKRQKIDLWRACPASSRHFASWWIDVEIEGAVRSGCVFWWFSSSFPPVLDGLCHCKFNSYFKGYPGSRINTNETVSQSTFVNAEQESLGSSGGRTEVKRLYCWMWSAVREVFWAKGSGGRRGCRWRPAELHSMSAALF